MLRCDVSFDPSRDPRYEPLEPTPDEVGAWASRERMRREAWLAGPTQDEQDEWARRYRQRAALGFAESRLGPSRDEVAEWAQREHKRRQAWLEGPTDQEKRDWARGHRRRRLAGLPESDLPPTENEITAWADRERARRRAWLEGPTAEEQQRWIRSERGSIWGDVASGSQGSEIESELFDVADRVLREVDLATKGSLVALARAPFAIWSSLVRSGRRFEDDFYQPPPRRRVRF
jgi:hypothetical protein